MDNSPTSFTFTISNLTAATTPPSLKTAENIVLNVLEISAKSEDSSYRRDDKAVYVNGYLPGFILAIHTAYQSHYPLKLSVSDFIIMIGQGLSKHINNNAEKLRDNFVNFEGKETIEIRRDGFVMGKQNDWSTVFGDFAVEIKKRVKADVYDIVIDDTSVATPTTRIVSEITLMDAMQSYFQYLVSTLCGIPQITLEGTKEDWEKLRQKVNSLVDLNKDDKLDLKWWLDSLVPVVDKICDTAIKKVVDTEFWCGIYKYESFGSGSPQISGWINVFLPYLVRGRNTFPNPVIDTNQIPTLYSKVPFTWNYSGTYYPMDFYGGFVGAKYNSNDNTVQPAHFWTVVYNQTTTEGEEQIESGAQ